jgi:hypothetical protein
MNRKRSARTLRSGLYAAAIPAFVFGLTFYAAILYLN